MVHVQLRHLSNCEIISFTLTCTNAPVNEAATVPPVNTRESGEREGGGIESVICGNQSYSCTYTCTCTCTSMR